MTSSLEHNCCPAGYPEAWATYRRACAVVSTSSCARSLAFQSISDWRRKGESTFLLPMRRLPPRPSRASRESSTGRILPRRSRARRQTREPQRTHPPMQLTRRTAVAMLRPPPQLRGRNSAVWNVPLAGLPTARQVAVMARGSHNSSAATFRGAGKVCFLQKSSTVTKKQSQHFCETWRCGGLQILLPTSLLLCTKEDE
jgi:hypothetical protein